MSKDDIIRELLAYVRLDPEGDKTVAEFDDLCARAHAAIGQEDPAVCRLQFPDGSVPGNAQEAAEGWKRWADTFLERVRVCERELREIKGLPELPGKFPWSSPTVAVARIRAAAEGKEGP